MVSGVMQAGEPRMARIESLRAIAALGVLFAHCYGTAHGYRAVVYATFLHRILLGGGLLLALFFALSGYLLFWPFVRRDYAGAGPVDLGRYARNRVLRIAPLYYVAVVILLLVREHGGSAEQWWRFGLFAESLSSRTVGTVDGLMWSLVVEVQFYILLPLGAAVLAYLASGDRRRATALVAIVGVWRRLSATRSSMPWRPTALSGATRCPPTSSSSTPACCSHSCAARGRRIPRCGYAVRWDAPMRGWWPPPCCG